MARKCLKSSSLKPSIEILKSQFLPDYPSGSSITYYDGKLYIIGDDANELLIVDRDFNKVKSITLFHYPGKRIPKPEKNDLETSTIVTLEGVDYLFALGSASRPNRTNGILIPLKNFQDSDPVQTINCSEFMNRLRRRDIGDLNIEGSCVIGNHFVMSNRANLGHPDNHLIFTSLNFWEDQNQAVILVSVLTIPASDTKAIIGVSELCYEKSNDRLLMTFSSEMTTNAYEDGIVGDSYLGWINDISEKIDTPKINIDGLIKLSEYRLFVGEKIEGLCIENLEGDSYSIDLVSDDDKGHSKLFKIKAYIPIR